MLCIEGRGALIGICDGKSQIPKYGVYSQNLSIVPKIKFTDD